jgi:predicted deacetylase
MYILPKYKFAYLAAPRTASKATSQALLARGATLFGSHHSIEDLPPGWVIASTVRNHWDAMISWWFKNGKIGKFEEFLPRFCLNNPNFVINHTLWAKYIDKSTHILRFESLQRDLDAVLEFAGIEPMKLPLVLDSKRENAPYQIFYKRFAKDWVQNYFNDEIQKYGYKF